MPSSTSMLEAKIGSSWPHLGTSSGQMDLWSASTMWTSFSPLGCTALKLCSINMWMPFNMPCKSTKCRTCCTTWMITLLLVHQTPQFVPATSWPWLLHVRSLASLSSQKSYKTCYNHKFPWGRHQLSYHGGQNWPQLLLRNYFTTGGYLRPSICPQTDYSIIGGQTSLCVLGMQAW